MVDRQFVYPTEEVQDVDILLTNKNAMVGLGYALQAILGSSTVVDGLACVPTTPASLGVNVGAGSIYSLAQIDPTAYGSVAADTVNQIVKQGIVIGTTNFACPAPVTVGQSVVYLVQAAYQDVDGGATNEPFVSATDGSVTYSTVNTVRKGVCVLNLKAGVAATTGTQVTPTPDVGFTSLYAITVANGQTTVTSGNIAQLATAPFLSTKLPGVPTAIQQSTQNYADDTSGAANTIAIALSPIPAGLTKGMPIRVKVANTNTGAVVMNVNGLGNVSVVTANGSALPAGSLVANGIYTFAYDANGTRWQVQGITTAATANGYFYGTNSGGSANAQTLASVTPSGYTKTQGNAIAFTAGFTNTGSTTLNVNSTGATAVKIDTGSGLAALTGGEIVSGNDYVVYYDGTQYVLIDPSTLAFLNSPALTGTPTAPTAAPGTNTTQLATTAFIQAAIAAAAVLTKTFSTSGQTISSGGSLTIAHGLGKKPFTLMTTIVCGTAEYNYSVGDEMLVSLGGPFSGTSVTATGSSVTFDATNIYVKWANATNAFDVMLDKSTGGPVNLTNANWTLSIRAAA